jgi:hypothetical protein
LGVTITKLNAKELISHLRSRNCAKLFEGWLTNHGGDTKARLAIKIIQFCYTDLLSSHEKNLFDRIEDYGGASEEVLQGLKSTFANEIQGLPLIPMASGDVKVIQSRGERPCVSTARQRFLAPSIGRRLVHPDALGIATLFQDPSFLKSAHIDTFSPAMLLSHVETSFPPNWKGRSVIAWSGEEMTSSSSKSGSSVLSGSPSPLWIFNFWQEINFAQISAADKIFSNWPLIPISSNELLSCSLSAAVLYVSEDQFDQERYDSLMRESSDSVASSSGSELDDDDSKTESQIGSQNIVSPSSGGTVAPIAGSSSVGDSIEDRTASEGHSEDSGGGRMSSRDGIYNVLKKLGMPLVRACFVSPVVSSAHTVRPLSNSQLPSRVIESLAILTSTMKETMTMVPGSGSGNSGGGKLAYQVTKDTWLKWERLSLEERLSLLSFFDNQASVVVGGYSLAEKKTISQLPLFRTLTGDFVSIHGRDFYLLQSGTEAEDLFLPLEVQRFVLERTEQTPVGLLKVLGVEELTEETALQRFTLPAFDSISSENQDTLRNFIVEKWPKLRTSSSLINALKKMPVAVNGSGDAVCASELLDPKHALLSRIFDDEPHKFPSGTFLSSDRALSFLSDVGLQRIIDPSLFVECALKIQSKCMEGANGDAKFRPGAQSDQRLLHCSEKLAVLAAHLSDHFIEHFQSLYSPKMCGNLADIFFLPVPTITIDTDTLIRGGVSVPAVNQAGKDATMASQLARFCDVLIWNDRQLAWTIKNVLPDRFVPPQVSWKYLKIESPPGVEKIIAHLTNLSNFVMDEVHVDGMSTTLSRMNKPDFLKIFRHLEKEVSEHGTASSASAIGIETLPCVPIGKDLVRPQQIYRRLKDSLPPLLYRAPENIEDLRCVCFKSLPSQDDYLDTILQFKRTVGNSPLNSQEISVVLNIAHLFTETATTTATWNLQKPVEKGDFLIPNKSGCLVPARQCVFDDEPSLTSRIFDPRNQSSKDGTSLHVAHPKLPCSVAEKLHIHCVSKIMEERLTADFEPTPVASMVFEPTENTTGGATNSDNVRAILEEEQRLTLCIQSKDFAKAVISISNRDSAEDSISSMQRTQHNGMHNAHSLVDYDHRIRELNGLLQTWQVCFVSSLVTQFVPNIELLGEASQFHKVNSPAEWFLRHSDKRILLSLTAVGGVTDPLKVSDVAAELSLKVLGPRNSGFLRVIHSLAVAMGQLVCDVAPLKQPLVLAAALSCQKSHDISDVLHRLKVTLTEESMNEIVRGTPGQIVTPEDKARLKISPLHYFTRGEIVAVRNNTSEGDRDNVRYGIVKSVICNSIVKSARHGSFHGDSKNNSLDDDNAVSSVVEVQVSSETTKLFPKTSIYIFTQTSAENAVGAERTEKLRSGSSSTLDPSNNDSESSSSSSSGIRAILQQNKVPPISDCLGKDSEEVPSSTKEQEVFEAVNDLLCSLNLKVSPDVISLANENARLRAENERFEKMQNGMRKQLSRYAEFVDRLEAGMICPITQEVMQYPGVAGDGHSYEGSRTSLTCSCGCG